MGTLGSLFKGSKRDITWHIPNDEFNQFDIGQSDSDGNLPKSAMRYLDAGSRSHLERLLDLWFAPKRFESTALYERLGVLLVKQFAPTGGDFVNRRYGVTIADIRGTLDSLIKFERMTRRLEAIHVIVFLGFLTFSFRRAIVRQTTFLDFGFAILVYILLILSPAMLQRYNRLRVYASIRHFAVRQLREPKYQGVVYG